MPCSGITIIAKPGPETSFLDCQIHVPSSHSKYQSTLILTHKYKSILFLRVHLELGSRGWKDQSVCSGQVILFFTSFCNVQSYSNSSRNLKWIPYMLTTKNSVLRALQPEDSGPSGLRNASLLKPSTNSVKC